MATTTARGPLVVLRLVHLLLRMFLLLLLVRPVVFCFARRHIRNPTLRCVLPPSTTGRGMVAVSGGGSRCGAVLAMMMLLPLMVVVVVLTVAAA
jgi:hypothetical protein